jgi:tripartite-type tricarboxylate transporter receptor subunit TctC
MKMRMITTLAALVVGAMLTAPSLARAAEAYPQQKLVKFIVTTAAGTSPDTIARIVARGLSDRLKQQFIVENRGGANGRVAIDMVTNAAPDGYTLLVTGSSTMASDPYLRPKAGEVILNGLTPVTKLTGVEFYFIAHQKLGIKTFAEAVQLIKAKPGVYNVASSTIGSFPNLSAELLKLLAGLDYVVVPYNGDAAAAAALAGGNTEFLFGTATVADPLLKAGTAVLLASGGAKRDASLPDMPTLAESGVPGYNVTGWMGIMAPKGTSPEIVNLIQSNVADILSDAETKERLNQMFLQTIITTPAQFDAELTQERKQWQTLVQKLGLNLEQ